MKADADTGRAQTQLAADGFRVELGDVAQADQGPIPEVEVVQGVGEIDESRPVGIRRGRRSDDGELADRPTTPPTQDGAPRVVVERLTQQDIAERVGSSREMVSRIFKELTVGGYIEVARDEKGDASHVLVVGGDDTGERHLVAFGGSLDDASSDRAFYHCTAFDHDL